MSDTQTQQKLPTNQQFVEAVKGQLTEWQVSTVEGLCHSQTETVIEDLVPYYGDPASNDTLQPDVSTFKQVFRDFQEQKERPTFNDLTQPEVTELIALLAPHFRAPAEEATEEQAETSDTSSGDLDSHPF